MSGFERSIESGFYLFIFLLPWQTRLIWRDATLNGFTWEYGRFSLYATQLLLWAVLLLYGVWLVSNRRPRWVGLAAIFERLKNPVTAIYALALLGVAIAAASILWAFDRELAYYRWFILVQGVALMSMVLIFNFRFDRIAKVWVASAAIQGVFGIWQFLTQYVPANKWLGLAEHISTLGGAIILETHNERWLRAYGSLPHPNILAGWLVVAVMLLIYLAFIAQSRPQRLFVLASLIGIIPAIFFTFGRSAWIALVVSLFLLGVWLARQPQRQWRQRFWQLILLIVIMVSVLGWNLSGPFITRLQGVEPLEVNSIKLRLTFTQQAAELIQQHWLGGVGIGNYTLGVYHDINSTWPGYYYQPVHNIFLLALAELGIIGAAAFIGLLGLLFWTGVRQLRGLEHVTVLLGLVAILIISLFDHYFWTLEFGVVVFWLVVGLNLRQLK